MGRPHLGTFLATRSPNRSVLSLAWFLLLRMLCADLRLVCQDYDGGDCCECTCEGDEDDCKTFACIDPEAPCVDEGLLTVDMVENCRVSWPGQRE